jgi:hypothetical protein
VILKEKYMNKKKYFNSVLCFSVIFCAFFFSACDDLNITTIPEFINDNLNKKKNVAEGENPGNNLDPGDSGQPDNNGNPSDGGSGGDPVEPEPSLIFYVAEDASGTGASAEDPMDINDFFSIAIMDIVEPVKVILIQSIGEEGTFVIPSGKTILIEPLSDNLEIRKITNPGPLFEVQGTLTIQGKADNNTLTCKGLPNNDDALFCVESGGTLSMNAHAIITGNTNSGDGGGISIKGGGEFTMNGGEISGNTANFGGGIFINGDNDNDFGTPNFTMTHGTISGNTANNGGGIAVLDSSFLMNGDANISANTVINGGAGGGIYADDGSITIRGGTIGGEDNDNDITNGNPNANTASTGGGLYLGDSSFFMNNSNGTSLIEGNTASIDGGGVYVTAASLQRFAMSSGSIKSNISQSGKGGGVYVGPFYQFDMSGADSKIIGNTAAFGGGVFVDISSIQFTMTGGTIGQDSDIPGNRNTATNSGGGVYINNGGKFEMINSTIEGNRAHSASGGGGVMVYDINSEFTMGANSTIKNNIATNGPGGGVSLIGGGTFVMEDSTASISSNTAQSNGGGVYLSGAGSELTMDSGLINENEAVDGGGVYNEKGNFTLNSGSIIENNTASNGGGGVYYKDSFPEDGFFTMNAGSYITSNTAPSGGGVYFITPPTSYTIIPENITGTGSQIFGTQFDDK